MKESWATSDFELFPSKQTSNDHISDGSQSCVIIVLCVLSGFRASASVIFTFEKKKRFEMTKTSSLESQIF